MSADQGRSWQRTLPAWVGQRDRSCGVEGSASETLEPFLKAKTKTAVSTVDAEECMRVSLKKNLNASRPSEYPSVRGGKCQNVRLDHRLQTQNLLWHINEFPDVSNTESTV